MRVPLANAVIHLAAIAGRLGRRIDLARLNALSDSNPWAPAIWKIGMRQPESLPSCANCASFTWTDTMVTGETLDERIDASGASVDRAFVRPMTDPIRETGGLVAFIGKLALHGAVIKRAAADLTLFEREGRAVVFESLADLAARIDDPDLDVTPDDILVLQNAGPASEATMPEAGYLPIRRRSPRPGSCCKDLGWGARKSPGGHGIPLQPADSAQET